MNGWTNRPTWLVIMHQENDPALYNYWMSRAEELSPEELAEELKEDIKARINFHAKGAARGAGGQLMRDLLGANPSVFDCHDTLESINFEEIAEAWKDECE